MRSSLLVSILFSPCVSIAADQTANAVLVVGGTESGCAAAVQAARMGVKRIVLVNPCEFSCFFVPLLLQPLVLLVAAKAALRIS